MSLEKIRDIYQAAKNTQDSLNKRQSVRAEARSERLAQRLADKITNKLYQNMVRAARDGEEFYIPMGLTDDRTKREIRSPDISDFYDINDPVDLRAYDKVLEFCQKKGYSPQNQYSDTYYGESGYPTRYILIKWTGEDDS